MTEAIADKTLNTVEEAAYLEFDFTDEASCDAEFPGCLDEYSSFLLDDVGFVKWFRGERTTRDDGKTITTGYGFIHSRAGDVYFRLPNAQKYEFDPTTNGRKQVRQYRRINPGQPVTFSSKVTERGLRCDALIFWEAEEFEKIVKQEAACTPFPHRLVTVTKRIEVRQNRTVSVDETVTWEGTDLDAFRLECPRIDPKFKVFKLAPVVEDGIKTLTAQRVEYRDMLNGAEHKPWVVCLDPR